MSTTRDQQLTFCSICTNRKFSTQKGLLCGLTNDYANFEESCPDFLLDKSEKKKKLKFDLENAGSDKASKATDFRKNKETGGVISIIGFAMLIFCLLYLNGILPLFISASVLAYGIRTYNRGDRQENIIASSKKFEEEHLEK